MEQNTDLMAGEFTVEQLEEGVHHVNNPILE